MIPFNKPYLTGNEVKYLKEAVDLGKISGNGKFTKKCQSYFQNHYNFKKTLLTTSCTDALEMASILIGLSPGDEVIIPSYTFCEYSYPFYPQRSKVILLIPMKAILI